MKQILIFTTTAIFLVGCGGGSNGGSDGGSGLTPPSSDVIMVPSQIYTVYPGDKVIKTSTNALVKIANSNGSDESTIVLVDGNATIIRNP